MESFSATDRPGGEDTSPQEQARRSGLVRLLFAAVSVALLIAFWFVVVMITGLPLLAVVPLALAVLGNRLMATRYGLIACIVAACVVVSSDTGLWGQLGMFFRN